IRDCPNEGVNALIEERFFAGFIHCYFIAFGVVIGGAIIGSIGSFATGNPPISAIHRIAKSLRIWAIAAAIGGTFDAIATFERGFLKVQPLILSNKLYISFPRWLVSKPR